VSAETVALLAVGYLSILVVVLAMLAAAGRADRAAERHADMARRAAGTRRRFRRRRASERQEVASDGSPVQRRTR
jgi:hypothetical protein